MTQRAQVRCRLESWALKYPFRITGYDFTDAQLVFVEVLREGAVGRGECAGVYYHNDTPEHALAEIERVRADVEHGASRDDLLSLLPPGGARNALDCALWDLEAKLHQRPVWQLAGLQAPRPLITTYTIGADDPRRMAELAKAFAGARALKLKLTGTPQDVECVRAVRAERPDVWLGVDANQGFSRDFFFTMLPVLQEAGVQLIEQPFPLDRDEEMEDLNSPIPVAADESAQTPEDLSALRGRCNVINIKLDKCGGLTTALSMAARARELGFGLMVGNMIGTSLAMAPAFVLGQRCDINDLDGPLLLRDDRKPSAEYTDGRIWCSERVWGGAHAEITA